MPLVMDPKGPGPEITLYPDSIDITTNLGSFQTNKYL